MGKDPQFEPHYTVLRIPTSSQNLTELITRFRETKLAALQADPSTFVQRYDLESRQPVSVWQARLARQNTIFVCVATSKPELSAEDALLGGEWVGFAAVRGPFSYEDYYTVPESAEIVPEDFEVESRWFVYDLYTFPDHRGRGVARKLGEGLLSFVAEHSRAMDGQTAKERARLRLIVDPRKTWVVENYGHLGFQKSGMATLREGLMANGMEESIPEDTKSTEALRAMWETRYGLVMEKVIDVA
jgi:GNAT superfamily N-acetyltransferase